MSGGAATSLSEALGSEAMLVSTAGPGSLLDARIARGALEAGINVETPPHAASTAANSTFNRAGAGVTLQNGTSFALAEVKPPEPVLAPQRPEPSPVAPAPGVPGMG